MNNQNVLSEQHLNCLHILDALLGNALLDVDTEAKDALASFSDYAWSCRRGVDEARFDALMAWGHEGTLTRSLLDELMELVSDEGEAHVYFFIYQGHKMIANLTL